MPHLPASSVLSDIKVIELTIARAGPTAGRQMADWGADVIRIEPPEGDSAIGEPMRRHSPDRQNLNRNKRSLSLNLKEPDGRAIFLRLAETADVIIENFRPRVKTKLGLDYEAIAAINPRIVYASASAYGQEGPYRDKPGVDQIAQGMGGHMSVTGLPGQGPVRSGAAIADMATGILTANGILLALYERERSGRGQWVNTNLLHSQIFLLDFQAARYTVAGDVPGQAGNNHPTFTPMGTFKTRDGWVNIAPMGNRWEQLCRVIGTADLLETERYDTEPKRLEHRQEVNDRIEECTVTKTTAEWVAIFDEAEIASGPVYTLDQTFADPQVRHLGVAAPVETPTLGTINLIAQPIVLHRTPASISRAAPELGEHTDEILKEHGYDDAQIAGFRARGVI